MVMKGKKGVIIGVANNRSIAYGIAKSCVSQGAEVALTYINDRFAKKIRPLAEGLNCDKLYKYDSTVSEDLDNLKASLEKDFGKIDFIVHSIAYADKSFLNNQFMNVSKEAFLQSLDISAYSLVEIARELKPILNENSSILALTYLGGVKYIPNYNIMGVSKAALDACVRYLSVDLGGDNIRINALSSGPIKTLAAAGISDFKFILDWNKHNSPLQKNVSLESVGDSGMYLLSDLSRSVTGEIHYVDGGYNIMGMAHVEYNEEGQADLTYLKNKK
jgi:enoyl-[acyl-carrier protein] reductase I